MLYDPAVSVSRVTLPEDAGRPLDLGIIETLAFRLVAGGSVAPVKLRRRADGYLELEDGRHRFVAALIAGLPTVAAVISGPGAVVPRDPS